MVQSIGLGQFNPYFKSQPAENQRRIAYPLDPNIEENRNGVPQSDGTRVYSPQPTPVTFTPVVPVEPTENIFAGAEKKVAHIGDGELHRTSDPNSMYPGFYSPLPGRENNYIAQKYDLLG